MRLELSHHYGLEDFRDFGCIAIPIDAHKKFLIMMPGQVHPEHSHPNKTETFELLWGDLTITSDDGRMLLKGCGKFVVGPNKMHTMRTQHGAVMIESWDIDETISTYANEEINSVTRESRKTVFEF